jgi:hypothetical protein
MMVHYDHGMHMSFVSSWSMMRAYMSCVRWSCADL